MRNAMAYEVYVNGDFWICAAERGNSRGYAVMQTKGVASERVSAAFMRTEDESLTKAKEICDLYAAGKLPRKV